MFQLLNLKQYPHAAWYWAELSGTRRRSLDLFLRETEYRLACAHNLLDARREGLIIDLGFQSLLARDQTFEQPAHA